MSKRAGQQSERGRHSQGIMGYSVLNLLAIKIQSEMGGDTDDLISSQNVTVLIGKMSIFYQFTNQFRSVMRPIKINDYVLWFSAI